LKFRILHRDAVRCLHYANLDNENFKLLKSCQKGDVEKVITSYLVRTCTSVAK